MTNLSSPPSLPPALSARAIRPIPLAAASSSPTPQQVVRRFGWTFACAMYAVGCLVAALWAAHGEKTFHKMSYLSLAFMQFLIVFFFFFYQMASFVRPLQQVHLRELQHVTLRPWWLAFLWVGAVFGCLGLGFVWMFRAGWL